MQPLDQNVRNKGNTLMYILSLQLNLVIQHLEMCSGSLRRRAAIKLPLTCHKNQKIHIWCDTVMKVHVKHDKVIRSAVNMSVSLNVYNL